MPPHTDYYEQDNDNFSDDDDDNDGFEEDMAALARACMIAGPNNDAEDEIPVQKDPLLSAGDSIVPLPAADAADSDDDDEQSDLECLKRVQSLYQSPDSILPPITLASDDDDDEDDFETVRAIFNRFATYEKGKLLCILSRLWWMNGYLEFWLEKFRKFEIYLNFNEWLLGILIREVLASLKFMWISISYDGVL